jgi:glyoxylase-like metal-dependent hydrolase (beta-lactamase superfamily II)
MNLPSDHYHTLQLADGVYALINHPQGWGIGNMGIIDIGDKTLLFDSSMTPTSALEAKQIAESVTRRSVDIIINSHYHNDHIWGNQVFSKQTQIISSAKTRGLIETEGAEELSWFQANSSELLAKLTGQLENESEASKKQELLLAVIYYQALAESVPNIEVRLPEITFEHQLTIYGSKRSAEVITYQNGHTADDAILFLPEDGIVFMADLLFVKTHPFLVEADLTGLVSILDEVSNLDAEKYVSGHGTVGTKSDISLMKDYVHYCQTISNDFIEGKLPAASVEEIPIPKQFEEWQLSNFFYINLNHLLNHRQR